MSYDTWFAFNLGLMVGGWSMIVAMRLLLPGMLRRRGIVPKSESEDTP